MRWQLLPFVMSLACQSADGQGTADVPSFEVSGDSAQMGFDTPFSIAVHFSSAARIPAEIRWKQVEGPPVRDIAVTAGGLRFSARTPPLSESREGALPWGVVPISPRTRGQVVLEAEWHLAGDEPPRRERITVAAAVRSRGLPNVPVEQRLYLGGKGWRVKEAPPDGRATVQERNGIGSFCPDARGIWLLMDGEGRALRIQAGRYVETPLDCGRAGCHEGIARAARASPMTWALARRLGERAHHADDAVPARSSSEVSCAMACHATGEPGTHDGGFFDVASELHLTSSLGNVRDIAALPRALRRLGSVGCLACHGPSALPEAEARWSILRSDVCAHCHDAPPRYGHVVAWQTTSMARADRDPRARSDAACTPCHTTWGLLREIAPTGKDGEAHAGVPPAGVGTIGIGCAACHAVHDAAGPTEPRRGLLRAPRLSPMFDAVPEEARARSATCFGCHAPRDGARLAQASAAALWAGRGGVDPEMGTPLSGPSPHLSVEGGCVACHRQGPEEIERGRSHGFQANRHRCASCHAEPGRALSWDDEGARMEKEAQSLWDDLIRLGALTAPTRAAGPPHATMTAAREAPAPLTRAAFDLSLLLEDRGFLAHNLPYARVLLEKAKQTIERALRAKKDRHREETRSWVR